MNETKKFGAKELGMTLLSFSSAVSVFIAATTYHYSALRSNNIAVPTITVTGTGEASVAPDIATVTFSVSEVSGTVKEGQAKVDGVIQKVNEGLKGLGISSKDIKTVSYTVNPRYSYPQMICTTNSCPSPAPKLEGYEIGEYMSVTVRKIDSAGDVLALLGKNEVKDISGPQFSVENNDTLLAKARSLAVEKAKAKAKETASALGAALGDVRGYSENTGGNYPMPMYAKADMAAGSLERVTLSQGETKASVTVSLTYSLK
jgi:uncharacterized protein